MVLTIVWNIICLLLTKHTTYRSLVQTKLANAHPLLFLLWNSLLFHLSYLTMYCRNSELLNVFLLSYSVASFLVLTPIMSNDYLYHILPCFLFNRLWTLKELGMNADWKKLTSKILKLYTHLYQSKTMGNFFSRNLKFFFLIVFNYWIFNFCIFSWL